MEYATWTNLHLLLSKVATFFMPADVVTVLIAICHPYPTIPRRSFFTRITNDQRSSVTATYGSLEKKPPRRGHNSGISVPNWFSETYRKTDSTCFCSIPRASKLSSLKSRIQPKRVLSNIFQRWSLDAAYL